MGLSLWVFFIYLQSFSSVDFCLTGFSGLKLFSHKYFQSYIFQVSDRLGFLEFLALKF